MHQRMPRGGSSRHEDLTGSYIGYRLEKDLRPGIRKEVPFSENDSQPRALVRGKLQRKIVDDVEERALKETELRNEPFAGSDSSPPVTTDATFPKLAALSARTFLNHLEPDSPRNAVKSTQVISGRGAREGSGKTTNVKVEEVMGDHQIVTSKENGHLVSDLEVQDTHHGVQLPNTEPASCGQRTLIRLAAMKAGTSLTLPPSVRVSELQDEADFMHRFK